MIVRRGDVVLADLPFSDRTGSKKRPALVVQSDRNNARLDDIILALITTVIERAAHEPTQLLIATNTPGGRASGLLHDSVVKCEHLITLHRRFVGRVIGRLSPQTMEAINSCLKLSLGLGSRLRHRTPCGGPVELPKTSQATVRFGQCTCGPWRRKRRRFGGPARRNSLSRKTASKKNPPTFSAFIIAAVPSWTMKTTFWRPPLDRRAWRLPMSCINLVQNSCPACRTASNPL